MARRQPILVKDFDPNVSANAARMYGVYDGHAFHITANRATAIQKVYARSECSIWESVGNRWVRRGLKYGWPKEGDPCDVCGLPLDKIGGHYTHRVTGKWCFVRGPGGKIDDPLDLRFMCPECTRFNES